MFSDQEMGTPQEKPEDTRQVSNGTGAQPEETIREGQPGEKPITVPCAATPTFAKAAAFAKAVAGGKAINAEDIFQWEHGVAVEPWPEPVDGKALLDDLESLIVLYVLLPKWAAEMLALWVLHTYAFKLRQVATYIGIESPEKRCGKTTLLTVLCELVNRPVVASNISSPAFFRVIEETRPTLLIDEGDTFLKRHGELRGILSF